MAHLPAEGFERGGHTGSMGELPLFATSYGGGVEFVLLIFHFILGASPSKVAAPPSNVDWL